MKKGPRHPVIIQAAFRLTVCSSSAATTAPPMVLLHVKHGGSSFLMAAACSSTTEAVVLRACGTWNARLRLDKLCDAADKVVGTGKCEERAAAEIAAAVVRARQLIGDPPVAELAASAMEAAALEIRGCVALAFPKGAKPVSVKAALQDDSAPDKLDLDAAAASLWLGGRAFAAGAALSARVGTNEKTKIVAKLSADASAPAAANAAPAASVENALLRKYISEHPEATGSKRRRDEGGAAAGGGAGKGKGGQGEDEHDPPPRVTEEQFTALRNSKEICRYMRDERLQTLIRKIEGAGDRQRALDTALRRDKEFEEVVFQILVTIGAAKRTADNGLESTL